MRKKLKLIFFLSSFLPLILFLIIAIGAMYEQNRMTMTINAKSMDEQENTNNISNTGSLTINQNVEAYRQQVSEVAATYGIENYTDLLLAIMMQESRGIGTDVFQSSESLGLPRGSLTVVASINQGVKLISERLAAVNVTSPTDIENIRTALQGYNYGAGYISYVLASDGKWTQENANAYAEQKSNGIKRNSFDSIRLGEWNYGDQYYTQHVLRYYTKANIESGSSNDVVAAAEQQIGKPYVWGATGPDSFDCSGLVYYVFRQTGKYTGERYTAAKYKEIAIPITATEAMPGDLVFFTNFYGTHHVGIYAGNGMMIHAPKEGDVVKYANVAGEKNDVITYGRLGS